MSFLSAIEIADLHQQAYIAVLDSLIDWGDKADFAEKVGITPRFFRYLRDPCDNRHPSQETAAAIANALPLPTTQKQAVLEHMILARESQVEANDAIQSQLPDRPIEDLLDELRRLSQEASFASDPEESRKKHRIVHKASDHLLNSATLNPYPLATTELCLIANEAESVLNRHVEALSHAMRARSITERVNLRELSIRQRMTFVDLRINALRLEAVSYSNLDSFKRAISVHERAEQLLATEQFKHRSDFWKPHLYRDKINAIRGMPRFAISTAEGVVHQVNDALETGVYTPKEAELLSFLIHSSLVRTYLKHGSSRSVKKAKHVLNAKLDPNHELEYIGPLHQTLLLRTWARYYGEQGDRQGWQHFISSALETALAAGLQHQVDEIRAEYQDSIRRGL